MQNTVASQNSPVTLLKHGGGWKREHDGGNTQIEITLWSGNFTFFMASLVFYFY